MEHEKRVWVGVNLETQAKIDNVLPSKMGLCGPQAGNKQNHKA